jgi:hypothetical protein
MHLLLPAARREPRDALVFSPLAWLKLQWFCHAGGTEVGGFGVSAAHDPLYVEDFVTVRQRASAVSVQFEDAAVADLFDRLVDRGLPPDRFARIWIHTHPGTSPLPSVTDVETFARSFGGCDWAVMFILSRTAEAYARLAFRAGPGGCVLLPTAVCWADWPRTATAGTAVGALVQQWQQEYASHVQPVMPTLPVIAGHDPAPGAAAAWWDVDPWSEALDGIFYEPVFPEGLHASSHGDVA